MTTISKKQYILSSKRLKVTGMHELNIYGVYLYFDSRLNVQEYSSKSGKKILLIGNAYCMDMAAKSVEDDITLWDGIDITKLTKFWTGRWALITENEFVMDATGLMSSYYSIKDGAWYISSSLALLSSIIGTSINTVVPSKGLNWQIVPDSIVDGINQLICTQKFVFDSQNLYIKPRIWFANYRHLTIEQKCETVAKLLVNGLKNISKYSGRQIILALTGGKDSRLVLAALLRADVPFSLYTAEHENISFSDRTIPKIIARDFGINFHYIKRNKISEELLTDYKVFTAWNTFGEDAMFYACKQFAELPQNAIIIRSSLFEAGQSYCRQIAGAELESFESGLTKYYSELKTNISQKQAFQKWLNYTLETAIDYIDIRDRFYIEQRVGSWVAAIEQSLDMNDFLSIQIANCVELLSILLSCNEEERKKLLLSLETIRILEPKLLRYPINKRTILDWIIYIKSIIKNPKAKICNFINRHNKG